MPLINCKIHLELSWKNNCVMPTTANTTFQMTSSKLYVQIVTLSTKDNVNLTKQLNQGFKRYVYGNEYKSKIETKQASNQNPIRFPLDVTKLINCLFLLLKMLMMMIIELKEAVVQNIYQLQCTD